jgi:hypothetical protein
MEHVTVAVSPSESSICTVNHDDPAVVGVPEIAPVEVFKVNPAGSPPAVIEKV